MLVIRKLLAHERGDLRNHLLSMDAEDRRLRFGHAVSAESILAYTTGIRWPQCWIVGAFEDGVLRGVAELRTGGRPCADSRTAELSVTVERAYQNRGIGTRLLERALLIARNRGFQSLFLLCLPENVKMQHIARKFGKQMSFRDGDVELRIITPAPDALSCYTEMLDDAAGLWQSALTWPTLPATRALPLAS